MNTDLFGTPFLQRVGEAQTHAIAAIPPSMAIPPTVSSGLEPDLGISPVKQTLAGLSQYSEYNTLSGKLPTPHKPEMNLTTTTPNIKAPPCTAALGTCPCPQSVAWQYTFQNCAPKFFPLPQNCEIRPYPANYRVYDLNELNYERSRTLNSNWNPYHFYNNQLGFYQFLAADLNLNNDPNLKPMNLHRPLTQYCFGCQSRKPGSVPAGSACPYVCPPPYLSF
jgi:hypothetical protein